MTSHNGLFIKKIIGNPLVWFFLGIILAFSFGCEDKKMADPEGMLKARSVEYWEKRLVDKDTQAAYEMEAEKDRIPYEEYQEQVKNAGQLTYLKVNVGKFSITGDKANVDMSITYNVPGYPKALDGPIMNDPWVIEKNQWMHVLTKEKHVIPK
jgi:hypothetical protein